jgi:acetyl-CoA C-acetyltransferase/acetyl-CoA acyltransferase
MRDAYIVDAVRTPFGARDGVFSELHPQDLAAEPLVALEERNGFTGPEDVNDVFYGCVNLMDEQAKNHRSPGIDGRGLG